MKKTYPLTHPKKQVDRLIDSIKSDIRKYLKRERAKKLPEGIDYWDFDCKFGPSAEAAKSVHVAELAKTIDTGKAEAFESCYVEIIAKPAKRMKREAD
ncbi:MAG: hypothetical protein ACI81V_000827 [Lentimonas sp.]|jgi:hypothetical protein